MSAKGWKTFLVPFLIAIVMGGFVIVAVPQRAGAAIVGGPTFIITDIPRVVERAITTAKDRIKSLLKVAGDVAVKTGVRIFYSKLAQFTTEFVATAGTGQKPLFITRGSFFQDVFNAAQNDFLDNLGRDVFGQSLAAPDVETQQKISLIARGIINPNTVCEDDCQKSYNDQQSEIKTLEFDLAFARDALKAQQASGAAGPYAIDCPLTYDANGQNPQWRPGGESTRAEGETCINDLQTILSQRRQTASTSLSSCIRACVQRRQQTTRTDPALNQLVGNEAVAAAVQDVFQPERNDLGNILKIVAEAQNKGAEAAAFEQVAQNVQVGPTRTLAGVIKAPGSLTQEAVQKAIRESTTSENVVTGSRIADVIKAAFADALVQRLYRSWFLSKCGLNPEACKSPTGTSPQSRFLFGGAGTSGQAAAQIISAQVGKIQLTAGDPSRNPISVIDDLEANGIIDHRFRQAIEEQLTVREAIDKGFLDATRTFGFDVNKQEPADGYPFRTILYLRTARIVPVGWELAAKYGRDFDPANRGLGDLIELSKVCGQNADHDADPAVTKFCSGGANPGKSCNVAGECGVDPAGKPGACVERFTAGPFCGLVDENWVLKAPLSYCRKEGAGEQLISKIFICDEDTNGNGRVDCSDPKRGENAGGGDIGRFEIQRKIETCVDTPTCIAENEDGTCRSYGYCFQELPTFRFDGTSCPAYYVSCQDYAKPNGETVAYLSKTVDRDGCSADNAGCSWYCGDQQDSNGNWLCTVDPNNPEVGVPVECPSGETCTCRLPGGETCTVVGGPGARSCQTPSGALCTLGLNRSHFDRDVEACDPSAEGCREFIATSSPTNLIANGTFEQYQGTIDDGVPDTIKGWDAENPQHQIVTSDLGIGRANTAAALIPSGGSELAFTNYRVSPALPGFDTGRPLNFQTFTISFYGKAQAGSCNGNYGLRDPRPGGFSVAPLAEYGTDWKRYSFTHEWRFPGDETYDNDPTKHVIQPFIKSASCNIIADNVQLEIGSGTDYKEYASVNVTDLNKTRRVCSRIDVGCEQYRPVVGGDLINGVVNALNRCSAEDVGCRQYRKEAIEHIPFRPAVDPVNVVVSSAKFCEASQVGCEEYTNLDVAARGGEAREYFTSIRQCVKPAEGASQATYFSWEGNDRSGFQLRSFRLKVSNLADRLIIGNGVERGAAPCTNLKVGDVAEGDNNPACIDSADPGSPQYVAECKLEDLATNPDCTQYFDGEGHVFYRLRSRTIPVSDDCHPYRNTIDERLGANNIYHVLADQSTRCAAAAAECRAFTGNTGLNTQVVFKDDFEGANVVSNNWQGVGGPAPSLSSESVNAGGRSMSATGTVATQDGVLQDKLHRNTSYVLSFWAKPNGATKIEQAFLYVNGTPFALGGSVTLAQDWHPYTMGPATVTNDPTGVQAQLRIRATDAGGNPANVFLDNIILREITDSLFLIDNSFRTCEDSELGCEAYTDRRNNTNYLKSFTRLCSNDAVGCTAFIDTQNSADPFTSLPIRGVSVPADRTVTLVNEPKALCAAADKGCTAFGQPTIDVNKKPSSFETVYLKDQPDRHVQILCAASEVMCTEFTSSDGSKSYFKDPGAQTCEFKRLGGEADFHWYLTGTTLRCPSTTPPPEGIPTGRACVKFCQGGTRPGLACTSNSDCPTSFGTCVSAGATKKCQGGLVPGAICDDDSDCPPLPGSCTGDDAVVGRACTVNDDCKVSGVPAGICDLWTGICPEEQSGCNEYRDPSDPNPCRSNCPLELSGGKPLPVDESCKPTRCEDGKDDGNLCTSNADCRDGICSGEGIPGCRSYTYLRQTVEQNAALCNGRVNVKEGCRPFNDTSNPTLNFRGF